MARPDASNPSLGGSEPDRRALLAETRDRLTRLEAEAHRLRAQLARLEAAGEDAAAEALEAQLELVTREQSTLAPVPASALVDTPSEPTPS